MNDIFKRDGFDLHYITEGHGPNILVIGSHIYYPRIFSSSLKHQFKFTFLDHRGFCPNTITDENAFSLDALLNDIHLFQQHQNLGPCLLLGHSLHALIAIEYAKKYPQHVLGLILVATSPIAGPVLHETANAYFQSHASPSRQAKLSQTLSQFTMDDFISRMHAFGPMLWYDEQYDASLLWEEVRMHEIGANHIWGSLFEEYEITKNLERIQCPIFLGLGRYDYFNPPDLWNAYRSHFPNLTLHIFEKSGHTPPIEEPSAFDQKVLNWYKKIENH